jgi:hypothetical protein
MKEEMQRDGSLEQFKLQVREQKCITKLLELAKITEVEPKAEKHKVEAPKHKKTAEKTPEKPAKKAEIAAKHPHTKAAKAQDEKKPAKKAKPTPRKKKT